MSGETDLSRLLINLQPALESGEYVFCCLPFPAVGMLPAQALASCVEEEGLSLILPRALAESAGLEFSGVFRRIVLRVHSSLNAVGLTAAVANCLSRHGIPANVVAAFHHDHVFVPAEQADAALLALQILAREAGA